MNNYKVKWRKWKDPLQRLHNKAKNKQLEDEFGDHSTSEDFGDLDNYTGAVMQTDYGFIPINETNLPSTAFNFWRGDTNFVLQAKHKFVLDTLLGIEALDIHTPYRFRIAIGTMFDEQDTLKRAEEVLIQACGGKSRSESNPYASLFKQYKFFAVVSNDESKRIFHGESPEEVNVQVKKYLEDYPSSHVFSSWHKGTPLKAPKN